MTRSTVTVFVAIAMCMLQHVCGFIGPATSLSSRSVTSFLLRAEQGDKLREENGIRPSLHPTTINVLAEALKVRATEGEQSKLRVSDTVQPIDVVMATSTIVANFLQKHRDASEQDGMTFEVKEEQTIAGRVVGVVIRVEELGSTLYDRVSPVSWVEKYSEWASFGILEDQSQVDARIKDDPLFTMSRAECLLAIFLNTVEAPKLQEIGETVPGGSQVDFIDADRLEVLLGDFQ
jgi:hypothetical protein